MSDIQSIEKYIDLIVRSIPLISIVFLALKPVRNAVGRWFADALTTGVRKDMNAGFDRIDTTLIDQKKL